jgi:predicted CopG family antitoxin
MVKTIRISDENHKELLKIQGEIQSETGEFTSMDDAIAEMVEAYKKKRK